MSWVPLVAGQVDRAIDVNREVGVHLDQAAKASLIPVVAAPGFVRDVFDREPLISGEPDVLDRLFPARPYGALENAIEPVARHDEPSPERLVAIDERAGARKPFFQPIEDLLKVR